MKTVYTTATGSKYIIDAETKTIQGGFIKNPVKLENFNISKIDGFPVLVANAYLDNKLQEIRTSPIVDISTQKELDMFLNISNLSNYDKTIFFKMLNNESISWELNEDKSMVFFSKEDKRNVLYMNDFVINRQKYMININSLNDLNTNLFKTELEKNNIRYISNSQYPKTLYFSALNYNKSLNIYNDINLHKDDIIEYRSNHSNFIIDKKNECLKTNSNTLKDFFGDKFNIDVENEGVKITFYKMNDIKMKDCPPGQVLDIATTKQTEYATVTTGVIQQTIITKNINEVSYNNDISHNKELNPKLQER